MSKSILRYNTALTKKQAKLFIPSSTWSWRTREAAPLCAWTIVWENQHSHLYKRMLRAPLPTKAAYKLNNFILYQQHTLQQKPQTQQERWEVAGISGIYSQVNPLLHLGHGATNQLNLLSLRLNAVTLHPTKHSWYTGCTREKCVNKWKKEKHGLVLKRTWVSFETVLSF